MNLDDRGRRAAGDVRRDVGDPAAVSGDDPFERFEDALARRTRNQRIATILVAGGLAILGVVFLGRAFGPKDEATPAATLPAGEILVGEWDESISQAHWFIVSTDGSDLADLGVLASCASWFPDGERILITNDAERGPGRPLRPAVISPDGTAIERLDATTDPNLELGCGDVSPDGSTIVLEGFNDEDQSRNGIFTVRADDGGGLERLTRGGDCCPDWSPDGTQAVFHRTRPGIQPDGAGALFVVDADGSDARRITPWGSAFLGQSWSRDGEWIAFQRPYGDLMLVHPDGSDLHQVPVRLPPGSGASEPSWSPDGRWIVFVLDRGVSSDVWATSIDGERLVRITTADGGSQASSPSWQP